MRMYKRNIYKETYFKKTFPKLYEKCREMLKDEEVYFGQCYQLNEDKELSIDERIEVYYNFENNENMTAFFTFSNKGELIKSDLNSID